MMLSAVSTGG